MPGRCAAPGDGGVLAALAQDLERPVPSLEVEAFDVCAQGFGDAQAVEGEQRCQGVVPGRVQAALEKEGAELVAVQPRGSGLVVGPGAAHVEGRISVDELLLLTVLVEALASVESRRATVERIRPVSSSTARTARDAPSER